MRRMLFRASAGWLAVAACALYVTEPRAPVVVEVGATAYARPSELLATVRNAGGSDAVFDPCSGIRLQRFTVANWIDVTTPASPDCVNRNDPMRTARLIARGGTTTVRLAIPGDFPVADYRLVVEVAPWSDGASGPAGAFASPRFRVVGAE